MPPRILLIEDNDLNRYLVTFLMEKHGFQVVAAPDGPAGISMAQEEKPDLILLDIQLPGMDGYAVARTLRQDSSLESVPLVAVSSYAMAGDRERALAAGFDGYLEKPIEPSEFVDQVRRFLNGAQGPKSPTG